MYRKISIDYKNHKSTEKLQVGEYRAVGPHQHFSNPSIPYRIGDEKKTFLTVR